MSRRKRRALLGLLCALAGNVRAQARAVELNTASQAELEKLKGIGVELSERLLKARSEAPFMDWRDLMARVRGVGPRLARRLSDQGLTVQGRAYAPE